MKRGISAFPFVEPSINNNPDIVDIHHGIDIRDYFAAKASDDDIKQIMGIKNHAITRQQARYLHADLMIAARESP